jgi:hypothetical protein
MTKKKFISKTEENTLLELNFVKTEYIHYELKIKHLNITLIVTSDKNLMIYQYHKFDPQIVRIGKFSMDKIINLIKILNKKP